MCRKRGVSDVTFYKWRSKYGGIKVPDARKLKALEAENGRLKKLLAEAMMDVSRLREILGKSSEAWPKEICRDWAIIEKNHSRRRACARIGIDRRACRDRSTRDDDGSLHRRLRELSSERRRFGYRRLHLLLRREGGDTNWIGGREAIGPVDRLQAAGLYRIYREERLTVRKRGGRKRARDTRAPMAIPQEPNQRWSPDIVSDALRGASVRTGCPVPLFYRLCAIRCPAGHRPAMSREGPHGSRLTISGPAGPRPDQRDWSLPSQAGAAR